MSDSEPDTMLPDVLLAFAVEPSHDRATLERYLKLYPQHAVDLIDLLSELRQAPSPRSAVQDSETAAKKAWDEFAGTKPRPESMTPLSDPFASFQGVAFASLARTLRVPRSILIALRDRLVIATSIPAPFFARLIRATRSTAEEFGRYLDLPPVVAPAASYKSDQKPEASAKASFEQLLDNSGVTADQKRDICTSSD
jgi:hypothetical protein